MDGDTEHRSEYGTELLGLLSGQEELAPSREANLAAQMIALSMNDARTPAPPTKGRSGGRVAKILELRRDAVAWVLDNPDNDASTPPGSFQWACMILDLNPTWARERILRNLRAEGFYPVPTLSEVLEAGRDPRAVKTKPVRTYHKIAYQHGPVLGAA